MKTMRMPGFTAEAAMRVMNARRGGGGGGALGFSCDPIGCVCIGTDDCIDLWVNTNLCSTSIICYDGYCYCVRN